MRPANDTTTFRAARWLTISVFVAADLFLLAAVGAYLTMGLTATTFVLGALAALGPTAMAETLMRRIVLDPERLRIVDLWRRREYPRSDITRVTYEKGSPVAVQLQDGRWVKLPDLGLSSQQVAGAIRGWLARR